jgi:hypothetical protein
LAKEDCALTSGSGAGVGKVAKAGTIEVLTKREFHARNPDSPSYLCCPDCDWLHLDELLPGTVHHCHQGEFTATNLLNFDISTFIDQVWANPASSFIGVDVTVGALCAILLIITEGRRLKMKLWGLYIASIFLVSFGFGFPLFLLAREQKLDAIAETAPCSAKI